MTTSVTLTSATGFEVDIADVLEKVGGICLETQNFLKAPNQPPFPSATLLAGETYRQRSVHAFSLDA